MPTGAEGGMTAMIVQFLPIIAIIALFYFLILRPQSQRVKQHQAQIAAIKRGDTVVLSSGTIGKVTRVEDAELNLGDRLLLSRSVQDVIRVAGLGLEQWPWHVIGDQQHLATGDGAVLLWRPTDGADICTVSFPLSPTQLLVIGQDLPDSVPINNLLAKNSRRWIVAERGKLKLDQVAARPKG